MSAQDFFAARCPNCGFEIAVRTAAQNAKLHALLADIAAQKLWDGERLGVDTWRRLITAAWSRVNNGEVKIYRAIDGKGVDALYRRTSRLSKKEMSDLLEFATAWAIDQGVELHDGFPTC